MANNHVNTGDEFDKKTSIYAKMFIIIVFCIAITFAILAFVLRFQNEKREAKLYNPSWKGEIQENGSINDMIVELPINAAEFVATARQLSPTVKKWRIKKLEGSLIDDRKVRTQMENYITDILRELGIAKGYTITKEFPKNFTARDLPKKLMKTYKKAGIKEEGVKIKINEITREKLIQLIQTVEDKYPFATAQSLSFGRDKEEDTGTNDTWKVELSFVWFFKESSKASK